MFEFNLILHKKRTVEKKSATENEHCEFFLIQEIRNLWASAMLLYCGKFFQIRILSARNKNSS